MKKLIALLSIMTLFASASLFAQDNENSDKEIGGSVGIHISILGLSPEASFIYKNFEAGIDIPMLSGTDYETDKKVFGVGFGMYAGFVQHPWTASYQNAFGFSFHYFPKDYIHATVFGDTLDDDFDLDNGAKILAFYYRGTAKFSPNVGLNYRLALPLYAGVSGGDSISIMDSQTSWACWLMALGSIGIGMRVEF